MKIDWTNNEIDLILSDYFSMLDLELKGIQIYKSKHRSALQKLLNNRSEGSIEFKHQNISAVLIKLGLPFIKGYKPKWNYQQILEVKTIEYLSNHKSQIEPSLVLFSDKNLENIPSVDFERIMEEAPERHLFEEQKELYGKKPIKINYLEREQNNISLGLKGEQLALEFERWRLIKEGNEKFAEQVEWIAKENDSAGFDILSKNSNGSDRFIEVKSTKLSKETPIFFSQNEYQFSLKNSDKYFLYRFFNLNLSPKLFSIKGTFDDFCNKEVVQYKGFF